MTRTFVVADAPARHHRPCMLEPVDLRGADVRHEPRAYLRAEADALFAALHAEIPWQTHRLKLFGREVDSPRLSCWIGDADAVYAYSRTRFEPLRWTPTVAWLRNDLAHRFGLRFNSVLANLYRDGRDSMGWHSDDEPELGAEPVIASLSFGATRCFRLRSRATREAALSLELAHGSLLVMAGATQRHYQHALPKRVRVDAPRINLTFRSIEPRYRRNRATSDIGADSQDKQDGRVGQVRRALRKPLIGRKFSP